MYCKVLYEDMKTRGYEEDNRGYLIYLVIEDIVPGTLELRWSCGETSKSLIPIQLTMPAGFPTRRGLIGNAGAPARPTPAQAVSAAKGRQGRQSTFRERGERLLWAHHLNGPFSVKTPILGLSVSRWTKIKNEP